MELYTKILDDLHAEKTKLEHVILAGQIASYESYRFFIGRLLGYRDAIEVCRDAAKGHINK